MDDLVDRYREIDECLERKGRKGRRNYPVFLNKFF
jgi:hypothetical protein